MFVPLIIFIVLALLFWRGLSNDAKIIPSPLINKPAPKFTLTTLAQTKQRYTEDIFKGHVSLLNVFATWCANCLEEHPMLMEIARNYPIAIYGLDYKDQRGAALKYLQQYGNPYRTVLFDANGEVAIDWGVYGAPETFIIDKYGIIRYKYIGAITKKVWYQQMLPVIQKLQAD
jgi:cytochrome c biogenesis protein CcmG/thiol:disulfide interchange protein DsbE